MHTHNKVSRAGSVQITGKGQYIGDEDLAAVTVAQHVGELLIVRLNDTGDKIPAAIDQ